MASEISNITALFCADNTVGVSQTEKNDSVQSQFAAFLNAGTSGQNTAQTYQADVNAATTGVNGKTQNTAYDRYQYKTGASIKTTENNGISQEKLSAMKDRLGKFADDVKNVLKEELAVTETQITNAMAVLGLEFSDLLDSKNLAALVTELTGCEEPMQLLVSEGFQKVMGAVEEIGSALLDELGMTKEEFLAACDEIAAQNVEQMPETQVAASGQADQTDTTARKDETVSETQMTEVTTDTENHTQIVVEKTEATDETAADGVTEEIPENNKEKVSGSEETPAPEQTAKETVEQVETEQSADGDTEAGNDSSKESEKEAAEKQVQGHGITVEQHTEQPVRVAAFGETHAAAQTYVNVQDIMEQISEYTRIFTAGDKNILEMQLNPENLGKIYIHVTEKAGTITAQISATNDNVREALQAQVADLKANLNQQGIKVDAVEVTIENHEFEQNLEENAGREQKKAEQEEEQRASTGRRNINLAEIDSLDGTMTEEESLAAKIMQENGNQMDVTA